MAQSALAKVEFEINVSGKMKDLVVWLWGTRIKFNGSGHAQLHQLFDSAVATGAAGIYAWGCLDPTLDITPMLINDIPPLNSWLGDSGGNYAWHAWADTLASTAPVVIESGSGSGLWSAQLNVISVASGIAQDLTDTRATWNFDVKGKIKDLAQSGAVIPAGAAHDATYAGSFGDSYVGAQ